MFNHRMSSMLFGVLICMAWCSLVCAQEISEGPYLGQTPPDLEPQIFAPGIVTLQTRSEWTGSFTPDGQEFYFTISNPSWTVNAVMVTSQEDGKWSTPVAASFSGQYIDWTVFLSPDGQRLFFSSSRPANNWLDFNIWMCERQGSGWSEPVKLAINSTSNDYAGTCTESGTLYFTSQRDGSTAIFRSVPVAGEYVVVEKLPSVINAGQDEQYPWIGPDESYLIFTSNRQGNKDLYISYRNQDDSWTEPVNLGPAVNTWDDEWNPSVSPDGKYLFYGRGRTIDGTNENLDLYWVDIGDVIPNSTDPNGPIQNLSSERRFSSIQSAIIYASAGDTIVIEPGVYHENIVLDKNINLQSVDPNDPYYVGGTIIQSDMDKPVLTLEDYAWGCEIAGLTLRAGSVGIKGTATNSTFRNCRIMDNVTDGVELFQSSKPHLLDCLITANGKAGIKMNYTSTGRSILYCEPTIENCYIVGNGEAGIVGGNPVVIDSVVQGQ